MPRGANPNSRANLKKAYNGRGGFDTETARIGNKKSNQAKKEYKSFQECFKDSITQEQREKLFEVIYRKASAGNLKAFEVLRDTLGEKPVERVVTAEIEQSTIDEVQNAIEQARLSNNES